MNQDITKNYDSINFEEKLTLFYLIESFNPKKNRLNIH